MVYWLVDFESYLLGSRIRQRVTRRSLDVKWPIIVNAKAAATLVRNTTGRDSWLLPRSLRSEEFRMIRPVLDSGRHLLGFPARTEITKRSVDAIRAMHIVRDRITKGHVSFWCYGYEKIACLPSWIEHFVAPSDSELIELLNRTAVFMVSSEYEGYGQPGAEAMACGAALVSTRNGGVDMYAVDRSSALLCPAHSPQCLADGVLELMANDELRSAIATNGIERATAVSWSTTLAEFERFLQLAANSVSAP
jgi:glycosyltransferase involved in cell wall biosynthesis